MTDAQQFEAFVRNYQNMVYSTAMRLLANESDAQDVSQEVFLRAFERFEQLRPESAGGWLKTVATNLCLNHLTRYRARWSFFSELTKGPESDEEIEFPADTDVPEDAAVGDRRVLVEAALQTLPTAQRVPLVLYHMDGLSYDEIAARLGVSLGKIKTDIFRGREMLRKKLRLKLADECG